MKRLNAKKIAAVVSGAALLGMGLAFASPVTYSNVPIINNAGQPVVQVVVGSLAKPTDAVAAGNIAAAIGNLAFTQKTISPLINTTAAKAALHVSVTSSSYTLSNKQVWLNESSTTSVQGAYSFSALIGSVLNRGIQLGSPQNTKSLQANSYSYLESNSLTLSPAASPYTVPGVPFSSVTASYNGGGVSFSSLTKGSSPSAYDNILQVSHSNLPALLSNYGNNGENEYLWLTGFPVYDQAINSLALLSAGGAYQVTFNKPIPSKTSSNSINTASISLLGTPYSIIGYNSVGVPQTSTTTTAPGGHIELAAALSNMTTLYVGNSTSVGPYRVELEGLGNTNQSGISTAAISIYYKNSSSPVNQSLIGTHNMSKFNVSGNILYVKVNQTFVGGSFSYQKWAKVQVYSNVFNVTSGQVYNQSTNPGWHDELLWTNGTSSGVSNELQSIVIYNTSPTTLLPGQSFSFITSPSAYKVTFTGQSLTSAANFDPITASLSAQSSVEYYNTPTKAGNGLGNINNITEPTQYLTVSSSIPNAFSYGGQVSSTAVYNLVPYTLTENNLGTPSNSPAADVVVKITGGVTDLLTSNAPLTVKVFGSKTSTSAPTQIATATFNSNTVADLTNVTSTQNIYNVTGIELTKAIPVNVVVSEASNTMATLTYGTPQILYSQTGKNYLMSTPGSSISYNQQNGQPTATFSLNFLPVNGVGSLKYGNYTINEYPVPGQTTPLDNLTFGIYNSTAGSSANPLFQLNQSNTGTRFNMTYVSSTNSVLQTSQGFMTERGSKIASITPSTVVVDYAKGVDQLQFSVSPSNVSTVTTSTFHTFGPYSVGQQTNLANVSVAKINATANVSVSNYTITGINNITAEPVTVTTPVLLTNLSVTAPLVVLDTSANPSDSLVLVGSGYVNTLSKTFQSSQNVTNPELNVTGGKIIQAGNQILVAGYTANQTIQAADRFIEDLYKNAATS